MGVIKGDIRSLDCSSCGFQLRWQLSAGLSALLAVNRELRNPFTKSSIKGRGSQVAGDGVAGDSTFWEEIKGISNIIAVKQISDDWGPATKLLAALQLPWIGQYSLLSVRYYPRKELKIIISTGAPEP